MEFKERLVQLRKKRGLTQNQMAEILGVKRARYNAWEQAISQPDLDTIKKIAKFHNVSVDYLIGSTEMRNAELDRKSEIDPDVRVIQRAATEMTPEQRKEALKMWDFLFKDVIEDAKKQEGVSEDEDEAENKKKG